jgi:hypothetical protein
MKYFLFYLTIYNFIFPIRLLLIPKSEYLLYLIPLIWASFNKGKILKALTIFEFKLTIVFVFFMLIIGAFSSIINGGDFISLTIFIKFIVAILFSLVIILWGISLFDKEFFKQLLSIITFSGLIIGITCVLEYFSFSFKILLLNIIDTTGNTEYGESFRTHGFASSGGASLSLGMSIVSILTYLRFKLSNNKLEAILYYNIFLLIFLSILVIGRTGFFLGLPVVIYFLIIEGSKFSNILPKILFLMIVFFGISEIINLISSDDLNILYKYGLEPIYNYVENDSFESKTTNQVSNMYYLPKFEHLILGAGYWRWPTYGYSLSDVGYMKILMSTGLIGFFIFFGFQLRLYVKAIRFYIRGFKFKIGFIFLFLLPFIAEFKEEFLTQNYGFKMLIILIVYSWIQNKNKKRCVE